MAPLWAQDLAQTARSNDVRPLAVSDLQGRDSKRFEGSVRPGSYDVPATKTAANIIDANEVFVSQDTSLASNETPKRNVENVVDLTPLRETASTDKDVSKGLALISATYRQIGTKADRSDCSTIGLSIEQRVKLDPSKVLEVVETEVAANASCACEVVKAAIHGSNADVGLTADIVEVAATTAPETMRIVSQCAIAAVPESLATVQAVLAKLDPNSGDGYSSKSGKEGIDAKSAKSAKEGPPPPPKIDSGNPLDLPPLGPPILPPPVYPPPVTAIDPGDR